MGNKKKEVEDVPAEKRGGEEKKGKSVRVAKVSRALEEILLLTECLHGKIRDRGLSSIDPETAQGIEQISIHIKEQLDRITEMVNGRSLEELIQTAMESLSDPDQYELSLGENGRLVVKQVGTRQEGNMTIHCACMNERSIGFFFPQLTPEHIKKLKDLARERQDQK